MNPPSPFTVLITGAGTATCQSVIKGFRAQSELPVRIVTVDMAATNAGRWMSDHFEAVPPASDQQFLPALIQICRRLQVDLVIPIVDYEFHCLARSKGEFEQFGCRVAISAPEVIDRCTDKWRTYHFLKAMGIGSPSTWLPHQLPSSARASSSPPAGEEPAAEPGHPSFPLFVKPRIMGRASIDAHRVDSPVQLEQYLQSIDQPLIQSLVTGREFTVDLLCDFHGKVVNGVVRERIETKSGVSSKGETVPPGTILSDAVRIAEALPIIGPANLQCIVQGATNYFIDINPRFSGALVLSIAAGFNSPLALARLALGQDTPRHIGQYEVGVQMYRFWQEVFVHPQRPSIPAAAGLAIDAPSLATGVAV